MRLGMRGMFPRTCTHTRAAHEEYTARADDSYSVNKFRSVLSAFRMTLSSPLISHSSNARLCLPCTRFAKITDVGENLTERCVASEELGGNMPHGHFSTLGINNGKFDEETNETCLKKSFK